MEGQTSKKILQGKLQRRLRNNPTDAERRLWCYLRSRQVSGAKFRRQHPVDRYILDFVCFEPKVVIELDGSQHTESSRYDAMRTAILERAGYVVLRFWNDDVFKQADAVLDVIWNTVTSRQTHPRPSPPLEGEGERLCR